MEKYGLLGKKLGHSYSPAIHYELGGYGYELFERQEDQIEQFLKESDWKGINVTIPYKKTVIPYLDEVSELAQKAGSVNTIIRREDGTLFGDNTDIFGFIAMVKASGIDVKGKKTLVLGSGGASVAVNVGLRELGTEPITISRSGENNYDNLEKHSDARIIVNTTPVGMYPENGVAPVDLKMFPDCEGVIDIIYNPAKTAIMLQADELGIKNISGLYMLVAQAHRASELFRNVTIPVSRIEEITNKLTLEMQNLVLIGMPGSGKSSIGRELAQLLNREYVDADREIEKKTGRHPSKIIKEDGEAVFRDIECEVIAELGKMSGRIIATGGGAVLREENYKSLHQNGVIIRINRAVEELPSDNRPLSQGANLSEMFKKRDPFYTRFADITIENTGTIQQAAEKIINQLKKL